MTLAVNGVFSYLATDGLGSVSAAFDANGTAVASALYRPYGSLRYSSGALPGSYGFTGQRSDAAVTGLDYDHARYYDPAAGGFTTADSLALDAKGAAQGKTRAVLDRYSYVGGNPETDTDPSGHVRCDSEDTSNCGGGGGGSGMCFVPGFCPPSNNREKACQQFPSLCTHQTGPSSQAKKKPKAEPVPDKERDIAWKEEVKLWNLIDQIGSLEDLITALFKNIPDPTGFGAPGALLLGLNAAIWALQRIQSLFVEQRGWSDSQWTAHNLILFQDQVIPLLDAAAVGLHAAVAAALELPAIPVPIGKGTTMPLGLIAGIYIAPIAAAIGTADVTVHITFSEEDWTILGCLPGCF